MESEEYYQWRRDSEGIGYKYPPKEKLPVLNNILGHMHLLLLKEGAVLRGAGYEINGEIVKLINGFGRYVDQVRELYLQAPAASEVHVHICVSSDDRVLPTNIVSSSDENSIIRNSGVGLFMNHKDARVKMGI